MTKQFEVTIKAYATVIVTADNTDEAHEFARDTISRGDFELDDFRSSEVKRAILPTVLRHADAVSFDLEEAQKFAKQNPSSKIPERLLKKGD